MAYRGREWIGTRELVLCEGRAFRIALTLKAAVLAVQPALGNVSLLPLAGEGLC